jgi:O-antigen ligase
MTSSAVSIGAAMQDGNSFDRVVYLVLILLAVWTLSSRSVNWNDFIKRNPALTALLLYSLLSIVWSDYPMVSVKRWLRDLGTFLAIFVVLSENYPQQAVEALLRRFCYLVIPFSAVLIKYFPGMGSGYGEWTGEWIITGVALGKNQLGALLLVCSVFLFWDISNRWKDRKDRQTKWSLYTNIVLLADAVWMLKKSNSSTSLVCLITSCTIIVFSHTGLIKRNPFRLKLLMPIAGSLYLILQVGFNIKAVLFHAVGRDTTVTGRTEIWEYLLSHNMNWLLGAGYESFWLGSRMQTVSDVVRLSVNQAHNGYIEYYINLGLVGLCLLGLFLIGRYFSIFKRLKTQPEFAILSFTFWIIQIIYNYSEAAFKFHMMWFAFLLVSIDFPTRESAVADVSPGDVPVRIQGRMSRPMAHFPSSSRDTRRNPLQPSSSRVVKSLRKRPG